ncbi:putative CDP-glycerol glycerophosphotransferase [Carnobacterium maltaromaticum]|uniref:CDP-glycerol glycerophosphotransferase family protein n=1 Tax=Carnobacterium maltaromaticum TaxID=2751 RepID=UPI00191BB47B|nr:CDP-glycerol glycerophosphotransferase family protein [Carnobacterium maltaromaticum]CAD5901923.1 putative CDP-glycerol glycerophosphotransferase [Carnobacterium maltaromaticum]
MKKVGIIGFNIFSPGGTTRSNINLIKEFSGSGYEVTLYNFKKFSNSDVLALRYKEEISGNVTFKTVRQLADDKLDIYFITRESFFPLAELIYYLNPKSIIVGEIHGPLSLIDEDKLTGLSYLTAIRVSTEQIRLKFMKEYNYDNVFVQTISLKHLTFLSYFEDQKTSNLFMHARFDEKTKDISFAIKLMDYLVNYLGHTEIKLYISGYGAGETLYKNLISYYSLNENVLINHSIPKQYVYLSTARYETLGFSIMEAISSGHKAILYGGDDGVIADIYQNFSMVNWINKTIEEDANIILESLNRSITELNYLQDKKRIETISFPEIYADTIVKKVERFSPTTNRKPYLNKMKTNKIQSIFKHLEMKHQENEFQKLRTFYTTIKDWPIVKTFLSVESIRKSGIIFFKYLASLISKTSDSKELNKDYYFIESFHGANFSGDPKYIALTIAENEPLSKIIVSSVNQLVDMEILSYGFIPVRTGSAEYVTMFKKCKTIIVNGNTLDKVGKDKGQIILQTWHGFPIKKMVNDLVDEKQRAIEALAFAPRMLKWDYLLTSSDLNTKLLTSAFHLEKNANLNIQETGAPKNEYLIKNKHSQIEKNRIHWKYFNRSVSDNKKYILFCPTWRKNKRKKVSSIDLKEFVQKLPDEYEIIVKLHPLEAKLRKHYKSLSPRIHCFFNELVDIQELYLISELLISDYSSAVIDFAHVEKRIIFLQEDQEDYQEKVGWYLDIKKMCNVKTNHYSIDELINEVTRPITDEELSYTRLLQKELVGEDKIGSSYKVWKLLENK